MTRAIHQKCPLCINYHLISSGRTKREIVPFAVIDSGLRWHVCAFDRKSQKFRGFVITRINRPTVPKVQPVVPNETSNRDIQWPRAIELELVPHPDQPWPEITKMDYSMDGYMLHMQQCAATAGYLLHRLSVDCLSGQSQRGHEYRLWPKDHLALYRVANATHDPGYKTPTPHPIGGGSV